MSTPPSRLGGEGGSNAGEMLKAVRQAGFDVAASFSEDQAVIRLRNYSATSADRDRAIEILRAEDWVADVADVAVGPCAPRGD